MFWHFRAILRLNLGGCMCVCVCVCVRARALKSHKRQDLLYNRKLLKYEI